ncbi:MAG TPA: phosphoglucosamine mutase [Pirellulales bacterium]|jgi:phosphomannomutase
MSQLIISVSGLRGIVGESLTAEVAVRYATAFEATLPPGPILLTYDGRPSGPMFLAAIADGLSAAGREVISGGIAATPTTGVLIVQHQAAGGIQISASHNPPEYNGSKLFAPIGRVVPAGVGQKVMIEYRKLAAFPAAVAEVGTSPLPKAKLLTDTTSAHIEKVLQTVNVGRIKSRKFNVLLDSNCGAGSVVGIPLLKELGCNLTLLGGEPTGHFKHTPEPTAENLAGVLPKVVENKCDIGFCQDPDADRLAVIDENGRYIGEEYTLAICVDHVLRNWPGPVVTNCSTSRMTEDLAKKYGVPFYRSAVGEANVVDCMLKHSAVLGGEGNGGVIDPRVVLVRDSFTAMALILDAMAARQLPISALADELPRYEICKTKIELSKQNLPSALTALEKHFADAAVDKLDGLRFDWPGKWLLVRASNTEPIVRAIAEAPTAAEAQRLCAEAGAVMSSM